MLSQTELQIVLYAAGVILAANLLTVLLHFLYKALSDSPLREAIRSIIFQLDKIADEMENAAKRRSAIQQINEVLGWRRILVPAALIGWIIDLEVKAIRKMQKTADTPNLHEEGDSDNAESNTSGTETTRFNGQE